MNKNKILGQKFLKSSRHVRIIGIIAIISFIILNAFNTGDGTLALICYILFTVALIAGFQSIILYFLGKYLINKQTK